METVRDEIKQNAEENGTKTLIVSHSSSTALINFTLTSEFIWSGSAEYAYGLSAQPRLAHSRGNVGLGIKGRLTPSISPGLESFNFLFFYTVKPHIYSF
jgi:hypothetical protein